MSKYLEAIEVHGIGARCLGAGDAHECAPSIAMTNPPEGLRQEGKKAFKSFVAWIVSALHALGHTVAKERNVPKDIARLGDLGVGFRAFRVDDALQWRCYVNPHIVSSEHTEALGEINGALYESVGDLCKAALNACGKKTEAEQKASRKAKKSKAEEAKLKARLEEEQKRDAKAKEEIEESHKESLEGFAKEALENKPSDGDSSAGKSDDDDSDDSDDSATGKEAEIDVEFELDQDEDSK